MRSYTLKYRSSVNGLMSSVEVDFYTLDAINDFVNENCIDCYSVTKRVKEVAR